MLELLTIGDSGREEPMKFSRIAMPLMAVALMSASPILALAQTSQTAQTQNQEWNAPPAGTEQERCEAEDRRQVVAPVCASSCEG